MDSFSNFLDSVKADEHLKDRTKMKVYQALVNVDKQNTKSNKRTGFTMKKGVIAACIAIAAGAVIFGGYHFYQFPINYVSLDINPSVELGINVFDRVVSAKATNEDGQCLLNATTKIENLSVDKAIDNLVQQAAEQKYIADDGSSVISVTVQSDDEDRALRLRKKSERGVGLAMSTKKIFAAVYGDCSKLSLRTEAKELNISPGKYKMIKMLQVLDPTVTVEQYADAKVNEIIRKANEILKSRISENENDEQTEKIAKRIKEAAEKSDKAKQNAKRNNNGKNNGQKENNNKTTTIGTKRTLPTQNNGNHQNKNKEKNKDKDNKTNNRNTNNRRNKETFNYQQSSTRNSHFTAPNPKSDERPGKTKTMPTATTTNLTQSNKNVE
ncbi:MAG: hypothetical protein PHX02_00640 [Oscillospiraceae bacterium]|nr:hypothetical protein [Oscillospiraceae bacterium]